MRNLCPLAPVLSAAIALCACGSSGSEAGEPDSGDSEDADGGDLGDGGGPVGGGDERVGTWDERDWSTGVYRISMAPGSYPTWLTGGATHTNVASSSWDGGNVARFTPPTTEQSYGGTGSLIVPDVQTVSVRFEMRTGSTYASGGQGFEDNKFMIIHAASGDRAMFNIQSNEAGKLQAAIAQGTTKQFNQATGNNTRIAFRGEGGDLFRWADTATVDGDIPPGEWISIEMQVSCEAALDGSGHIRAVVHRRSSASPVADWWIPWNFEGEAVECDEITSIESIGDYFNGTGDGGANTYFDIAGITVGIGQAGLLGPRDGFVE